MMSRRPTTAGRFSDRAMMAECEVRLPASVAMPSTSLRSNPAVSDGRKIVREDDGGRVEVVQFRLDLALQVAQHAARDVEEIGRAFAEIIVVELAHLARVGAHHLLVGEVDVDQPALQLLLHRFDQRGVFEQKDVRVENARVRFADGSGQLIADGLDLLARLEQRRLEAGDFAGDILRPNAALADDVLVGVEEEHRARWRCRERRPCPCILSSAVGVGGTDVSSGIGAKLLTLRRICELLIPRAP